MRKFEIISIQYLFRAMEWNGVIHVKITFSYDLPRITDHQHFKLLYIVKIAQIRPKYFLYLTFLDSCTV